MNFNDHNDSRHPVPHWYWGLQWTRGQECWSEMMVTTICQDWALPSPSQPSPAQAVAASQNKIWSWSRFSSTLLQCSSLTLTDGPRMEFLLGRKVLMRNGGDTTRAHNSYNQHSTSRPYWFLVCRQVRLPGTAGGETIIQCAHPIIVLVPVFHYLSTHGPTQGHHYLSLLLSVESVC